MKKIRPIILSVLWCVFISVLYVALNKSRETITLWSDGFFIGGLSLLCITVLRFTASKGAFDSFQYSFGNRRAGDTFYDYSLRKKEQRKQKDNGGLLYMLVTSVFFIGIAAILLVV